MNLWKKVLLSILLFTLSFLAAYWACCYMLPGWRIKLEADSMTYFMKSISHMVGLKSLVSLIPGLIIGSIPFWPSAFQRKRKP